MESAFKTSASAYAKKNILVLGEHAMTIPFVTEFNFEYGRCDRLSPLIRRVICNNPGPFTFTGTGNVAVIYPGPLDDAHLDAIMAALSPDEQVSHIVITHTHLDHSPLAMALRARTGAKIYAHAPGHAAAFDGPRLEEGDDADFAPDEIIAHSDLIKGGDWTLECVFTPGHMSGHMCYALVEEKVAYV